MKPMSDGNDTDTDTQQILHQFNAVYCIILITLGIIGNVLLLSTLIYKQIRPRQIRTTSMRSTTALSVRPVQASLKWKLRFESTADYLLFLLVFFEFTGIWVVLLWYGIHLAAGYNVSALSDIGCKIHMFASRFVLNMSLAMMCIFAVHRMISMRWPFATRKHVTRARLKYLLLGVAMLNVSKQIPVFLVFRVTKAEDGTNKCSPSLEEKDAILRDIYLYLEFFTHSGVGYALLIAVNVALYITMTKYNQQKDWDNTVFNSQRRVSNVTTNVPEGDKRYQTGLAATRIILWLSVIQVVSTTPYFLFVEANHRFNLNLFPVEYQTVVYYACLLAVYTNNALNYYIILCVSKQYRQLTTELLRLWIYGVQPV